jgi:polysaccharide pyruvyl transferase WcaK-like protein
MSPGSAVSEHILVILSLALLHRLGVRGPAERNAWLRSLLDSDFIGDIRGGDSFSDIYGFRRFLEGNLPIMSAILLGRPYTLLPQTYGPFRSRASRLIAAAILKQALAVLTRDRHCEGTVRVLAGKPPRFCPDVAFTLDPLKPNQVRWSPPEFDINVQQHPLVGINVSGLLYMGGYTGRNMFGLRSDYRGLIERVVEHFLSSTEATVVLLPHTFGAESEEEACASILQSVRRASRHRTFMLSAPLSDREVKWLIGRTDFFIGSRMHACIAALSQCVPAVGFAYSDKFLGVFESAGVGDATIDLRRFETTQVVHRVVTAFNERAKTARELRARMPMIQKDILDVFQGLLCASGF